MEVSSLYVLVHRPRRLCVVVRRRSDDARDCSEETCGEVVRREPVKGFLTTVSLVGHRQLIVRKRSVPVLRGAVSRRERMRLIS